MYVHTTSKWVIDLNVRLDTVKLLKENDREPYDINCSNICLIHGYVSILLPGTLGRLPRSSGEAPVLRCPEGLGAWFTEQGGASSSKDAGDEGERCLWEDLLRTAPTRPHHLFSI